MTAIEPQATAQLELRGTYDRLSIRGIFEPATQGGLGGPWQSGIVQTPKDSGNYVFLVTLDGGRYDDVLYEDGYLRWKSQDQQHLGTAAIQRFIAHDPEARNIHLFIRADKQPKYVYFGLLEYVTHDPEKQNPCEFVWRVMHWDLSGADLASMGLPFAPPLMPVTVQTPLPISDVKLVEVAPPPRRSNRSKPSGATTSRGSESQSGNEVDWALRDQRNRSLGDRGEKLVLHHERMKLTDAGREDLAKLVMHVAATDCSAGYDIQSFEPNGSVLRIEVKTTSGPKSTPFFISANEVRASEKYQDEYRIYRVFQLRGETDQAGLYVLKGDAKEVLELIPTSFRAQLLASDSDD
ncbi:DUF3427 domain-containing protein [Roseateles sp. So40a]|uniref:DUF3427 domain-containing protein n=1 Tax=Roseateles sp. So40a TaxID=3400226 RepID=UPI003A89069E